ncbi:hypothetical protein HQ535_07570 [bacterium]|nr:hypothetical protein [bacterium]
MVKCGRCRTQFDAPGIGRFACPACGTANEVRGDAPLSEAMPPEMPEQPPLPDEPSPRVACPVCGLSFIVGDVETAPCPNCRTDVIVGEEPA